MDKYISENYGITAESPWLKYPSYVVYRHENNKKWFAVIMELPKKKIGLTGNGAVNVVNFKCDPLIMGSLQNEGGIHKAYHMNKNHWITVRLDGSVAKEKIKWLLDLSYDLTSRTKKRGIL